MTISHTPYVRNACEGIFLPTPPPVAFIAGETKADLNITLKRYENYIGVLSGRARVSLRRRFA